MSNYISSRTNITDNNAAECAMALRELENKREWFAETLPKYPVEIKFADLRYVFCEISEIDSLIKTLDKRLTVYLEKKVK